MIEALVRTAMGSDVEDPWGRKSVFPYTVPDLSREGWEEVEGGKCGHVDILNRENRNI
jgi:hypothetical protein